MRLSLLLNRKVIIKITTQTKVSETSYLYITTGYKNLPTFNGICHVSHQVRQE